MERHPLVTHFLRGAQRPPVCSRVPSCSLWTHKSTELPCGGSLNQLFVCYGPSKRGLPATKLTLSRWIVDAISLAYESSGLLSSLGSRLTPPEVWRPPRPSCQVSPILDISMLHAGPYAFSFQRVSMQLNFLNGLHM